MGNLSEKQKQDHLRNWKFFSSTQMETQETRPTRSRSQPNSLAYKGGQSPHNTQYLSVIRNKNPTPSKCRIPPSFQSLSPHRAHQTSNQASTNQIHLMKNAHQLSPATNSKQSEESMNYHQIPQNQKSILLLQTMQKPNEAQIERKPIHFCLNIQNPQNQNPILDKNGTKQSSIPLPRSQLYQSPAINQSPLKPQQQCSLIQPQQFNNSSFKPPLQQQSQPTYILVQQQQKQQQPFQFQQIIKHPQQLNQPQLSQLPLQQRPSPQREQGYIKTIQLPLNHIQVQQENRFQHSKNISPQNNKPMIQLYQNLQVAPFKGIQNNENQVNYHIPKFQQQQQYKDCFPLPPSQINQQQTQGMPQQQQQEFKQGMPFMNLVNFQKTEGIQEQIRGRPQSSLSQFPQQMRQPSPLPLVIQSIQLNTPEKTIYYPPNPKSEEKITDNNGQSIQTNRLLSEVKFTSSQHLLPQYCHRNTHTSTHLNISQVEAKQINNQDMNQETFGLRGVHQKIPCEFKINQNYQANNMQSNSTPFINSEQKCNSSRNESSPLNQNNKKNIHYQKGEENQKIQKENDKLNSTCFNLSTSNNLIGQQKDNTTTMTATTPSNKSFNYQNRTPKNNENDKQFLKQDQNMNNTNSNILECQLGLTGGENIFIKKNFEIKQNEQNNNISKADGRYEYPFDHKIMQAQIQQNDLQERRLSFSPMQHDFQQETINEYSKQQEISYEYKDSKGKGDSKRMEIPQPNFCMYSGESETIQNFSHSTNNNGIQSKSQELLNRTIENQNKTIFNDEMININFQDFPSSEFLIPISLSPHQNIQNSSKQTYSNRSAFSFTDTKRAAVNNANKNDLTESTEKVRRFTLKIDSVNKKVINLDLNENILNENADLTTKSSTQTVNKAQENEFVLNEKNCNTFGSLEGNSEVEIEHFQDDKCRGNREKRPRIKIYHNKLEHIKLGQKITNTSGNSSTINNNNNSSFSSFGLTQNNCENQNQTVTSDLILYKFDENLNALIPVMIDLEDTVVLTKNQVINKNESSSNGSGSRKQNMNSITGQQSQQYLNDKFNSSSKCVHEALKSVENIFRQCDKIKRKDKSTEKRISIDKSIRDSSSSRQSSHSYQQIHHYKKQGLIVKPPFSLSSSTKKKQNN